MTVHRFEHDFIPPNGATLKAASAELRRIGESLLLDAVEKKPLGAISRRAKSRTKDLLIRLPFNGRAAQADARIFARRFLMTNPPLTNPAAQAIGARFSFFGLRRIWARISDRAHALLPDEMLQNMLFDLVGDVAWCDGQARLASGRVIREYLRIRVIFHPGEPPQPNLHPISYWFMLFLALRQGNGMGTLRWARWSLAQKAEKSRLVSTAVHIVRPFVAVGGWFLKTHIGRWCLVKPLSFLFGRRRHTLQATLERNVTMALSGGEWMSFWDLWLVRRCAQANVHLMPRALSEAVDALPALSLPQQQTSHPTMKKSWAKEIAPYAIR